MGCKTYVQISSSSQRDLLLTTLAATGGCYCFCAKTGKKHLVQMCNYYSVHGKVNRKCDN